MLLSLQKSTFMPVGSTIGFLLVAGMMAGCTSTEDASSAQCDNPPLEYQGRQYDHKVAVEGTPMDEEVGSATLKGCATREGDPVSADTEVRLYRIRDIDPAVALGTVGQNGALDEIWVAFEGEPLGYNALPDQVQQYVEP